MRPQLHTIYSRCQAMLLGLAVAIPAIAETDHPLQANSTLFPATDLIYTRNFSHNDSAYSEASLLLTDFHRVEKKHTDAITGVSHCNNNPDHFGAEALGARFYNWDSARQQYIVVAADGSPGDNCRRNRSIQVYDNSINGQLLSSIFLPSANIDGNTSVAADFNANGSEELFSVAYR